MRENAFPSISYEEYFLIKHFLCLFVFIVVSNLAKFRSVPQTGYRFLWSFCSIFGFRLGKLEDASNLRISIARSAARYRSTFSFEQDASFVLQSFDETSMDGCPLASVAEVTSGNGIARDGNEVEVTSLEEAKTVIAALRAKQRAQAHQMLAWRRTLKLQEDLVARLTREKAEQLRSLSSQLLLFESRLCRKQKEIEANLAQRESIILRQQRVIRQLQSRLAERTTTIRDSPPCDALDRLDSLGDSDSAVVLEEAADDPAPPRFRSNITDVTVIRSVSDAFEPSSKYSSMRRCNGFLRRPEILETVYSVEEDADNETNQEPLEQTETPEIDEKRSKNLGNGKGRLQDLYGSFERLAQDPDPPQNERPKDESQQAQVTYNRVMSNHRSVTKPKDVKYKRINKAKSKSLEELRGRLRNWVEKGNKIAISLDQSYA
ncbi:uncharacterized protein [Prorops nasuta]|uniref:uncharacterized protein isoform X2 n=1 Tax=Prorops nasuta TaxID=863751 RepID=UPI0034CE355E